MNLKKLLFISLALVGLSVLFTGCDDDERSGYLYFGTTSEEPAPRTDRDGRFSMMFNLDIRNVSGYSSYDHLSSIQMYDSHLSFETYGDYRDKGIVTLWLSTDNIRAYAFDLYFNGKGKAYLDTRDRNFSLFMEEVFYEMARYGRVRFYIDGLATWGNNAPIQFMDFDIESESRLRLLFNNGY